MSAANFTRADRPQLDRVLLVEDNAVIAMNTEALLEELGAVRVDVAGNVATAMDLLGGEGGFDLAILDYDLGGETSLPVAERLISAAVPIIISSGYGEHVQLPALFSDVPLLKKPYTLNDLRRLLAR